jgi:hypothetical protein
VSINLLDQPTVYKNDPLTSDDFRRKQSDMSLQMLERDRAGVKRGERRATDDRFQELGRRTGNAPSRTRFVNTD